VRRFLVTCLGNADAIFSRLWAELEQLGWLGANTVVVLVGDGAEWIWNRAWIFPRRCEILDFWHALEHAWRFARLPYGEGSKRAERWVHQLAQDLRAGKVEAVIQRLQRLTPSNEDARQYLKELIGYYRDNAQRMRYDEYLRLGYGIGSGAVESAHKQVVHARMRQAGMRWSEAGARRLLALRLQLLNDRWDMLDQLRHDIGGRLSGGRRPGGQRQPRIQIDEPGLIGHAVRALAPRLAMRFARSPVVIPADLRSRLEAARLELLALFRALDRMDLAPAEIPQLLLRQLFELDADYAEALWALDQTPGRFKLQAMLRDTSAALERMPQLLTKFRRLLPPRAQSTLLYQHSNVRFVRV